MLKDICVHAVWFLLAAVQPRPVAYLWLLYIYMLLMEMLASGGQQVCAPSLRWKIAVSNRHDSRSLVLLSCFSVGL